MILRCCIYGAFEEKSFQVLVGVILKNLNHRRCYAGSNNCKKCIGLLNCYACALFRMGGF